VFRELVAERLEFRYKSVLPNHLADHYHKDILFLYASHRNKITDSYEHGYALGCKYTIIETRKKGKKSNHAGWWQKYAGEWKDGVRNGYGILISQDYIGHKYQRLRECRGWKSIFMEGTWENDKLHGFGMSEEDLGTFLGNWEHGEKKFGRLTLPNDSFYEGEFKDNLYHGEGKFLHTNGDEFIGTYANGRRRDGKLVCVDGSYYIGTYVGGKICDGTGKERVRDGGTYQGGFKNSRRCGFGIRSYGNGDIYMGEWKDGVRNGYGATIYHEKNESKKKEVRGTSKNGKRHGKGYFLYRDGSVYEGKWKNGERVGDLQQVSASCLPDLPQCPDGI